MFGNSGFSNNCFSIRKRNNDALTNNIYSFFLEIHTDKQTNKQTDKQTNRQTHIRFYLEEDYQYRPEADVSHSVSVPPGSLGPF
jgi:hypothetical protein